MTDISAAIAAVNNAAASTTNRSGGRTHHRKSTERSNERPARSSSLPRCTDPACAQLSTFCADPACCTVYDCYACDAAAAFVASSTSINTAHHRWQSPPAMMAASTSSGRHCTVADCYEYRCNSLPRCMDSKCLCKPDHHQSDVNLVKHHSLPRCAPSASTDSGGSVAAAVGSHSFRPPKTDAEEQHYQHPRQQPRGYELPPHSHYQLQQQQPLQRGDSRASLPRTSSSSRKNHQQQSQGQPFYTNANYATLQPQSKANSATSNGKLLTKSVSAVSLNSRRRRHKTVHFGDNLLREVCHNRRHIVDPLLRKSGQPGRSRSGQPHQQQQQQHQQLSSCADAAAAGRPSGAAPLNSNIQLLYNFVEGVMSSWVDDDDDDDGGGGGGAARSGAESEPERGTMRPIHRCNRLRLQTIRRVVSEAAELRGTLRLGNSRYRHRHWRGTAKECNERFLKKVSPDGGGGEGRYEVVRRFCAGKWVDAAKR